MLIPYSPGLLGQLKASNENRVVEDGNLNRFNCYFNLFGNFRQDIQDTHIQDMQPLDGFLVTVNSKCIILDARITEEPKLKKNLFCSLHIPTTN